MIPQRLPRRLFAFVLMFVSIRARPLSGKVEAATETSVVISQVYGGGGNGGSTYKNDFIELFNLTAAPASLVWVQRAGTR